MDTSAIQSRQDALLAQVSAQRTKTQESNEPAVETRPDNAQVGSLQVPSDAVNASGETVNLSDTSLKLSTSSPVKSTDRSPPIENRDQAQQALSQLLEDFKSNPAQAQAAQSNVFSGAVKSLLG
ncbi:MAG: hypothetical protein Q7U38_01045 [Methylobacter sp.]|jgi:hypothetical protein|nr:hypothetical protein [Methylobacter sp.]MDP2100633.1 hypothetical protein [Methylobacter sp.]MDP2426588.1 hypothetical protein [Methylobacter sp.]MDP3056584.1 hypothetical protein [Methylobacter sp.]MDP3360965.1 hypothetical protein [Methylobacter sp.]